MTEDEIRLMLATTESHKIDLSGLDLSGLDLSGLDLSGADLSKTNLSKASLKRTNLGQAGLSGADLSHADARWSNLSGADLSGADLRWSDIGKANLSNADLKSANIRWAKMYGTIGDMRYIKSLFIETYPIVYTSDVLQVGCKRYSVDEWLCFNGEAILKMDGTEALYFWKKWRKYIEQIIKLSPALSTTGV